MNGEPDWGTYWGALAGFNLCASGPDDDPPNEIYTLSTCPYNDNLDALFRGIEFTIEGEWETFGGELRCEFKEAGREESAYVAFTAPGRHRCPVSDARVWYDTSKPPPTIADIEGI